MNSRFRPPLTLQQLHEIASRSRGDADAIALLWEIKRLHHVLTSADDYRESFAQVWRDEGHGTLAGLHMMRNMLSTEPAVAEHRAKKPRLRARDDDVAG